MGKKQLLLGSTTEEIIINFFHNKKYWVYLIPKKIGGQPFDIIACKNNETWFIDAKHIEEKIASFDFDRIEPNQQTSMSYARNYAGIKNLGFIIYWDRQPTKLYFLSYDLYLQCKREQKKSIKVDELISYENDNI